MPKLIKFILAIMVQITIILVIVIFKLLILGNGTEILLHVTPVDPRSPLRGDYVTFEYDISRVSRYWGNTIKPKNGDTVYVILSKNTQYWMVKNIQLHQPTEADTTFIKGRVVSGGEEDAYELHIVYGIEQYYIPEGTGNIDFGHKDVAAAVVVDENGNSVLKKLYLDKKPWP